MGKLRILAIIIVFLWPLIGAGDARALEAIYGVTQAGIPVVEITAEFDLNEQGYRMRSRSRAVGIGRIFAAHDIRSEVEGVWLGSGVDPKRFQAEGNWRGDQRRTVLLYRDGMPEALELERPEGAINQPVPITARRGTVDTLSAFAWLSRIVMRTGGCDLSGPVFDGRRRLEWSSKSLGQARIRHGGEEVDALHCRLESRLVAGFRVGDDPARAAEPRPATAWLARIDARLPPIPIRVEFPSTIFGTMRMELRHLAR